MSGGAPMVCGAGVLSESGFIGFTGFCRFVFDWRALARIRLGGISGYGKSASWASEILKILILTKARGRPNRARRPLDSRLRGNDGG